MERIRVRLRSDEESRRAVVGVDVRFVAARES